LAAGGRSASDLADCLVWELEVDSDSGSARKTTIRAARLAISGRAAKAAGFLQADRHRGLNFPKPH